MFSPSGSADRLRHWRLTACLGALALAGVGKTATAADNSTVVTGVTVTGAGQHGPVPSATASSDYAVTAQDIDSLPTGAASPLTDVLTQIPGVAIDQNQQIHIRNTEGPQFQYQINGVLVPLDINTNPPFISMINPMFIKRLDLMDGVLPARYSYATGGVVNITTKDGCEQPGGSVGVEVGQREVVEPSAQFGGCAGKFSYYVSGLYDQGQTAFSSATPGPDPVHDRTRQGQAFGSFAYQANASTKLSLIVSAAASTNQLPDVPGLDVDYQLAGVPNYSSGQINSYLNFQDYLAILALNGQTGGGLTYQLAYSAHYISQDYRPDNPGELIFQGVASTATHFDVDNTLEADVGGDIGRHHLSAGIYLGDYRVTVDDSSLVFPAFLTGQRTGADLIAMARGAAGSPQDNPKPEQSSTTPEQIINNIAATNILTGVYLDDLWRITDRLSANFGIRFDGLTGFTRHDQIDPTFNLSYRIAGEATVHAGYARYMQVPSFQGISPGAPRSFGGTTGAVLLGTASPLTEDDEEVDVGVVIPIGARFTVSEDNYYEKTDRYLDTGQLGSIPIFAPFNYANGYIWGSEVAFNYKSAALSAYLNLTFGQNWQKGLLTGQFNFDPFELFYIKTHFIPLDHQPTTGVSAGVSYRAGPYLLSVSGIYSSGLRGGTDDLTALPAMMQINGAIEGRFRLPGGRQIVDRLTIVNALDRTNLIRLPEGIGIAQAAYGPRFTVLDTVTVPF